MKRGSVVNRGSGLCVLVVGIGIGCPALAGGADDLSGDALLDAATRAVQTEERRRHQHNVESLRRSQSGSAARPADHPPMPDAQAGLPAASGRAGQSESDAAHTGFTHFRVGDRNVKAIVPEGDVMWVGTSAGAIRYDTTSDQYRLYDIRSGLLANGVFHLSHLGDEVVVGTYGGGLALLGADRETWRLYNIPEGLADAFVYDVDTVAGDLWVATWSGANRIIGGDPDDLSAWRTYTVENTNGGLPNDWVYAIAPGHNDDVWFATEGGLAHFDGEKWQHWTHADGLGAPYEEVRDQIAFRNDPANFSEHHSRQKREMGLENVDVAYNPNYIVSLLVDESGAVWCGTWGGGLARYKDGQWTNYTVDDGLPANHVFMLYSDSAKRLWIGTSNGLARLEPDGGFKTFTTVNGLFADTVFSMSEGNDGRLWIGSFGGVARIDSLE